VSIDQDGKTFPEGSTGFVERITGATKASAWEAAKPFIEEIQPAQNSPEPVAKTSTAVLGEVNTGAIPWGEDARKSRHKARL
jgi:hypothetical protein